MKREEAREILQEQIDKYGQEYDEEGIEALNMAIKALETQPCEDVISRAEAFIHIQKRLYETALNNKGIQCVASEVFGSIAEERLATWFNELPSVTPSIPDVENDFNLGYNCGYTDAMIDIAEGSDSE